MTIDRTVHKAEHTVYRQMDTKTLQYTGKINNERKNEKKTMQIIHKMNKTIQKMNDTQQHNTQDEQTLDNCQGLKCYTY